MRTQALRQFGPFVPNNVLRQATYNHPVFTADSLANGSWEKLPGGGFFPVYMRNPPTEPYYSAPIGPCVAVYMKVCRDRGSPFVGHMLYVVFVPDLPSSGAVPTWTEYMGYYYVVPDVFLVKRSYVVADIIDSARIQFYTPEGRLCETSLVKLISEQADPRDPHVQGMRQAIDDLDVHWGLFLRQLLMSMRAQNCPVKLLENPPAEQPFTVQTVEVKKKTDDDEPEAAAEEEDTDDSNRVAKVRSRLQ